MRISDWSSDVCSSDLAVAALGRARPFGQIAAALDRLEAHHRLQSLDAGQFRQIVTEQFVEMVGRARENLEQIVAFACGRVALDHGGVREDRGFEIDMRVEAETDLDETLHQIRDEAVWGTRG